MVFSTHVNQPCFFSFSSIGRQKILTPPVFYFLKNYRVTDTSNTSMGEMGKTCFKEENIKRLPSKSSKCYCFGQSRASRTQKFFLSATAMLFNVPWLAHCEIHFVGLELFPQFTATQNPIFNKNIKRYTEPRRRQIAYTHNMMTLFLKHFKNEVFLFHH